MRITRTEVRNYRSIFEHSSTSSGLRLDVADGLNVIVGRNNCGKSNLFRALSAALDPNYDFDPAVDTPGPKSHRYPSVQIWFELDPSDAEEAELLALAREYEQAATSSGFSRADANQIVLRVTYAPSEDGPTKKRERLVFLDGSDAPQVSGLMEQLADIVGRLRGLVRFVMIRSGESIASVLEGNFREILHTVVQEHMGEEFQRAEEHRQEYITGLQSELLSPLRETVEQLVRKVFPEIRDIHLTPTVSDIESTLSRVEIGLEDAVITPLSQKGTGVRGGVLVAMLQYLAERASKCVVFAIEEPEAFLHPAAQEDLRDGLEALADRPDVAVLLTTHSPFVLSRAANAKSVLLTKDHDGRTVVSKESYGGDMRVAVLAGIMKEQSLEDLLRQTTAIPEGKAAVLIVEGEGDKDYLELAATKLGRPGLIADLQIIPSHGTTRMVYAAVLASASSELPVAALVDNDVPGRRVYEALEKLVRPEAKGPMFQKKKNLFNYRLVFDGNYNDFPWEAEDLFPAELIEQFVDENGGTDGEYVDGMTKLPTGGKHFDMGHDGKTALGAFLRAELTPEHLGRWEELLVMIRKGLRLTEEAEHYLPVDVGAGDDEPSDEPSVKDPKEDERVLLVSQQYGHAQYMQSHVFAGEPGRGISPDVRHIAFYEDGEIRAEVPRVLARHDDLVFDTTIAESLDGSSNEADKALAAFIRDELDSGRRAPGETRQVFLLTNPQDPATIKLSEPIKNTKVSPGGKPMAWVVRTRMTWTSVLASGVTTTDELDELEEKMQ